MTENRWVTRKKFKLNQYYFEVDKDEGCHTNSVWYLLCDDNYVNKTRHGQSISREDIQRMLADMDFNHDDD